MGIPIATINLTSGSLVQGGSNGRAAATTAPSLTGSLQVDNLKLDGNTLSTQDTNGALTLAPNGTGDVIVDSDLLRLGGGAEAGTLSSNGAYDLVLETNSGTNSGTITITDGASGAITLACNGTGAIVASSVVKLAAAAGAAADNALLLGVGTSGDPALTASADKNMIELRCKSTATSGDFRGLYVRSDIGGAGGAGESLRGNTVLTAAAGGTVNGCHASLDLSSGSVTGMGTGVRAGLIVPNSAVSGGTMYGALAEIYSNGSSSDVSGATKHAILGVAASGDATGAANVLNAIAFDGTDGTGKMIYDHTGTAPANTDGSIRILINGVPKWLMYFDQQAA